MADLASTVPVEEIVRYGYSSLQNATMFEAPYAEENDETDMGVELNFAKESSEGLKVQVKRYSEESRRQASKFQKKEIISELFGDVIISISLK